MLVRIEFRGSSHIYLEYISKQNGKPKAHSVLTNNTSNLCTLAGTLALCQYIVALARYKWAKLLLWKKQPEFMGYKRSYCSYFNTGNCKEPHSTTAFGRAYHSGYSHNLYPALGADSSDDHEPERMRPGRLNSQGLSSTRCKSVGKTVPRRKWSSSLWTRRWR